jgi:hypothetical protein
MHLSPTIAVNFDRGYRAASVLSCPMSLTLGACILQTMSSTGTYEMTKASLTPLYKERKPPQFRVLELLQDRLVC